MFVDAVLLKLAIQCTFHLHEHTNLYTTAESVYLEAMMSNTSHLDVTATISDKIPRGRDNSPRKQIDQLGSSRSFRRSLLLQP